MQKQAATITPLPTRDQIVRKESVFKQFGFGNTYHRNLINDGLMPPSISLGLRSVGYIQSELDQVLAFMIAGKSKEKIRALVSHMVEQRKNAAVEVA